MWISTCRWMDLYIDIDLHKYIYMYIYRDLSQHSQIQKKCCLHLEMEELFFFGLAQMDSLSCILFEGAFQDGCVEKRERGSWMGRMEYTHTKSHTKRRVCLYLEKSDKRVKCMTVNKKGQGEIDGCH